VLATVRGLAGGFVGKRNSGRESSNKSRSVGGRRLRRLLRGGCSRAAPGLRFNEHLDETDGPLVFQHACKLGLEGIVSKRRDSRYRSGHWIKSKNPNAPAVKREAEEDWGR
jgi:hypothetical protein